MTIYILQLHSFIDLFDLVSVTSYLIADWVNGVLAGRRLENHMFVMHIIKW